MDRKWMFASRMSKEYADGVEDFINFALLHAGDDRGIACPCVKCCFLKWLTVENLREYLIIHGIDQNYTRWTWHGEKENTSAQLEWEDDGVEDGDRLEEMVHMVVEDFLDNPGDFEMLVSDSQKALYAGCTKFTRLSAILKLYNLKAGHGWTDKSFTALLELIKEMLPEDNVLPNRTYKAKKVMSYMVDKAIDPNGEIPCPDDEVQNLGGTIGTPIAWPKSLLLKENETSQTKQKSQREKAFIPPPQNVPTLPLQLSSSRMKMFALLAQKMDVSETIQVDMPGHIFYKAEIPTYVGKVELLRWLQKLEAEMCHMCVYIRFLYEKRCQGREDMYGFLKPERIAAITGDSLDTRARYIADVFVKEDFTPIFAPYNAEGHWMLAVIHPHECYVEWLDPLQQPPKEDATTLFDRAITLAHKDLNRLRARKVIKWTLIKCPTQSNNVECGYFVMRFMWEIIDRVWRNVPIKYIGKKCVGGMNTFTSEEIDEIHDDFLSFLEDHLY